MYVCLVLRIIILIRNMIKNALFFINWISRKIALKLYSIIEYNYLPKDFVSSSGYTKIKFARSLAFKILLLRFIRIYQRKRYRTDFLANTSVHRTLETFTVKILNHSRRTETDRYQDGGRGRGTDESQPRRLCNGGPSRGPTREVNVLQDLCPPSRLLLHSHLFSPLLSLSLRDPSFSYLFTLFLSRTRLYPRLPRGRRMPTTLAKATKLVEANKCATDWRGTSFRPSVIALA